MKRWIFFFFLVPLLVMGEERKLGVYVPVKEESDVYISGDGFKAICDFVFEKNVSLDPSQVHKGDLVFVDKDCLREFFSKIHPKIQNPYILVTHNGSYSRGCTTPGPYYLFLEDEKILAWFGNNPTIKHPKIIGLPQGLDSMLWKNGNINFYSDAIMNGHGEKNHLLYLNFPFKNHPLTRLQLYLFFVRNSFCFTSLEFNWANYVQGIYQSKFTLCPRSRGGDSFRVWEALILGSIPVVKHSALDSLYMDLPVLIVKDWDEITEELLEKKYQEMKKKQFSYSKLFISYWEKRIKKEKGA